MRTPAVRMYVCMYVPHVATHCTQSTVGAVGGLEHWNKVKAISEKSREKHDRVKYKSLRIAPCPSAELGMTKYYYTLNSEQFLHASRDIIRLYHETSRFR